MKQSNILLIATESVPYVKTGGVADVVHGLATELCAQGHNARIVIPCYRGLLDRGRMEQVASGLEVPLGEYVREATVWKLPTEPLTYLVQNDFYFGRAHLYGFLDDYERFIFFTRAVLEMLNSPDFRQNEQDWFPQIIQGYDWACGLIPSWLPLYEKQDPRFIATRFVLSVHNIGEQGVFGSRALRVAQLEAEGILTHVGEKHDGISLLGRGLLFADKVITVNPRYGMHNPLPESARTLKTVLKTRLEEDDLVGIRNAIDYRVFNPSDDCEIEKRFDEWSLRDRVHNKLALQRQLGFEQADNIPMVGMVTRLISLKGFDVFCGLKTIFDSGDVQLVILAEPGDPDYKKVFDEWEQDWNASGQNRPPWMRIFYEFDERLARRIYAGCDIFLLPSREEPCGIQQFIAMRYGSIPVVHRTGALHDSVTQYQYGMKLRNEAGQGTGLGFTFAEFTPEVFRNAVKAAIDLYQTDQGSWTEIQRHNIRQDFSWFQPAREYMGVYARALQGKRRKRVEGEPLQMDRNAQLLQAILEIDSLPGLAKGNVDEFLKQSARLVREVVQCDGVYVWKLDEETRPSSGDQAFQKMKIASLSLDRHHSPKAHDKLAVAEFLTEGSAKTWKRFVDLDMSRICKPISNVEKSDLAKGEGWVDGRFVPITAHSRIVGRIDVLFRSKVRAEEEWLTHTLTALASSLGFRLETVRLQQESEHILVTDSKLLCTRSLKEAVQTTLERAKILTHADGAWLYLFENGKLEATDPSDNSQAGLAMARSAFETRETVYSPDTSTSVSSQEKQFCFHSVMAIPLINRIKNEITGILEVAKDQPAAFSRDDERILMEHLAPQAAIAIENARWYEKRDQNRVEQMGKLSASMVGRGRFELFLDQIVKTTAEILGAQTASLFLVNERTKELQIRAAVGYHRPLLEHKASYGIGEDTTGWIAEIGRTFRADSFEELRLMSPWQGKHKEILSPQTPSAFLGIPLKITDKTGGQKHVIGVLQLEDPCHNHGSSKAVFSDEDVLLGEMMVNLIAIVIYQAQAGSLQLEKLSSNLEELSIALAGGREMRDLVDQIVKTMARVLGAEASSLYLIDEATNELVIQAATGYQQIHVGAGARYSLGEGITGWIAAKGELFRANSLQELFNHPAWKGKHPNEDRREPNSFLGLPLKVVDRFTSKEKVIGVLKVEEIVPSESHSERFFTDQDVLLVTMMANIIATVVYNTQVSSVQLQKLSSNLEELSIALAGGREMRDLVDQIVKTMARVLGAEASSLYLIDEATNELVIQTPPGYQQIHVGAGARYSLGEGITGWIAAKGELFRANSLQELFNHPAWKGKHPNEDRREPNSFLGLPLKVVDRFTSKEKVIGVLKVEEIVPSESHSERFFTDQDVLLVTMMANIIATVVYNTQVSSAQLQKLSSNLEELSIALAGGREMRDLVDQIVKTMARVLGAEASSLYLIDEATNELVIQAATGYQQIHVGAGARYSLGEGITGWIAAKGELFRANSLQELFDHPAWKGKHPNEDRREPNSFLGLPLKVVDRFTSKEKVIGVLKVEEIVPSESHPERFFTDQDVLLVTMMANIIATVIYNTRRGEARVGDILKRMGTLSDPVNASLDLLHTSACSADWGVIDQLAMAIASILDKKPDKAETEAKALFDARANPLLYNRIANWAQHEDVQWKFHFFDCVLKIGAESGSWDHLMDIARPWLALRGDVNDPQYFAEAANHLARKIAEAIRVEPIDRGTDPSAIWFGTVLDTARIFGDPIDRILLLVQRRGELDEDNLSRMHIFAEKGLKRPYQVLMFVPLMFSFASAHVERMKQRMRIHAMDVVVANIPEILHILEAARPEEAFRGLVLRQITTTSPFVMVGPVPDGMFFGRERELRAIIQYVGVGRSCVIIAGRRIGKTSVLSRLHRVRLPEVGFRTLYHDCSNTKSYDAFLATTIRNWRPEPPSSIAMTLGGLIENPPADKPVVLLLDEADKLVPFDRGNNWQLFNKLRDLINSGRAQVVLSGESTLREALRDPTSPLFNLVNEMRLGPLEPRDVRELVTRPLKQLEIQLVDEAAIVDRVYDFTSGHPNVVQRLCHRLVGRINERGTHRIALDDLNEVIRDPDFQRTDFLGTYWEAATCLEKIVSLLMADDVSIRTLKTVRHILAERCNLYPDAREVDDALQRLVDLRSILKRVSAGYDFAVKAFPHVVAGTMTLDDMLEILVEEYREMPNGS